MSETTVAAGWYVDPWQAAAHRWWNGAEWTGHVTGAGSILDAATVMVTFGVLDGSVSLTDGATTVLGALDLGPPSALGGAPLGGGGPVAGALEVMPQGGGYPGPPSPGSPPGAAAPSMNLTPVALRDRDGRPLLTFVPQAPTPQRAGMEVAVQGPDGVEMGRYVVGSGRNQSFDLVIAGRLVGHAEGQGRGQETALTVTGPGGEPLATLTTGRVRSAQGMSMTFTVHVMAPATGVPRCLLAALPVALVGVMAAGRAAMSGAAMLGGMPPMRGMGRRLGGLAVEGLVEGMLGGD